ncbi:MAG: ABC transporter permease [Aureliella sp.]
MRIRIYTPDQGLRRPVDLVYELVSDVWAGRELAWRLFLRDIKAQYRQTYFGYLWAFFPPLVASAPFIFLQSQGITNIDGTGIPYPAFAMIGTLLWQSFADALAAPVASINAAKPMLSKINFPREAILVAGMYAVAFSFAIRLVLLALVMLVWGVSPTASVMLFPVFAFGLFVAGFAIGMVLVPLGGLYGDVSRAIPIVAQFWMLLTPVVYPVQVDGMAAKLACFNPVSSIIVSARASLTGQPLDHAGLAFVIIVGAGIVSFFGVVGFRIAMPHLIARMGS